MKIGIHESITLDRIIELATQSMFSMSDYGLCLSCGEDQEGIEPDAELVRCVSCGARTVFGAERLLIEVQ